MAEPQVAGSAVLEILSPDKSHRSVPISELPFLLGRSSSVNHLQLSDSRISRSAAAIVFHERFFLEDRGQRGGLFLNGNKITKQPLEDGDVITLGGDGAYRIVFHTSLSDSSVQHLLTRIESISHSDSSGSSMAKINLLLEATMLLHSQLPLDAVLGAMLDHAIEVTGAERGLLIEADASGSLRTRLAHAGKGTPIAPESISPSKTVLRSAIERQSSIITADMHEAEEHLRAAESIVAQSLRSVVVIPLYAKHSGQEHKSDEGPKRHFLGVLYLDSRRPAAFSRLDRQILDAIGAEAASILDNARLVERERERQRMEQEVTIARDIQQALLPRGLRSFPSLAVSGMNLPCLGVGGDYFDVFPLGDERTAFLIADVSGKGLGAALLTTMLQGALTGMRVGGDPASVFDHLNRFLCEHSDVGRYATMFFGTLDRNGHFEFINAGHPSPILLRNGQVEEPFPSGCFPVGLLPEATFTACCFALQPGDTLVLYSDGVTEAGNAQEDMFGVERLRELLVAQDKVALEALQASILSAVATFSHGVAQADDITLLLARYEGPAQA